MWRLFQQIWNERGPYSEVSGKWLGKEPLTIFFHHILPKRNYEDLMLVKENIILLTFDEHQKVENDMYFYEEINKRRNELQRKDINN